MPLIVWFTSEMIRWPKNPKCWNANRNTQVPDATIITNYELAAAYYSPDLHNIECSCID